jgi:hypothetical protein
MGFRAPIAVAALCALAVAGCAAGPRPHPIVAQATPAGPEAGTGGTGTATVTDAGSGAGAPTSEKRRGEGTSERAARKTNRALGWIAIAIGSEAAIVAGVTSVMMLHYQSQRSDGCDANKVCTPEGLNANTQLSQLAGWNAAAYVVAAAGLGTGLFLLLTNPSDGSTHAEVGATPGGLTLRGAF